VLFDFGSLFVHYEFVSDPFQATCSEALIRATTKKISVKQFV